MKILVRGSNWIGDAVMNIPAMKELRRVFPDAEITLHTRSWAEGLFRDSQFIDELVTYDGAKWKFKDVYQQSEFLKGDKFDIAVLFPNSFESALTTLLTNVPRRFGYNKDLRGLLLTDPIAVPEWKGRRHEVYYYLNLVAEIEARMLGQRTILEPPEIALDITDERRAEARAFLRSAGVPDGQLIVGLGVGSTNSMAKRWPAERYAALNDRIQDELGATVMLLGDKKEIEVSNEVARLSKRKPNVLTGTTDLATAVAVLTEIDLFVSNDMGLAHVAPAVGTRTLVIFGPTNSVTTRPFSRLAEIIEAKVECAPCMLRDCPIDHRCMTNVSVENVFDNALMLLDLDGTD